MPVLAIGGEQSFGPTMAVVMREVATNVTELVIAEIRSLADGRAARRDGGGFAGLPRQGAVRCRNNCQAALADRFSLLISASSQRTLRGLRGGRRFCFGSDEIGLGRMYSDPIVPALA